MIFYVILKIAATLIAMVFASKGPRRPKELLKGNSNWFVDEDGHIVRVQTGNKIHLSH